MGKWEMGRFEWRLLNLILCQVRYYLFFLQKGCRIQGLANEWMRAHLYIHIFVSFSSGEGRHFCCAFLYSHPRANQHNSRVETDTREKRKADQWSQESNNWKERGILRVYRHVWTSDSKLWGWRENAPFEEVPDGCEREIIITRSFHENRNSIRMFNTLRF